jgi:hypothetical protein
MRLYLKFSLHNLTNISKYVHDYVVGLTVKLSNASFIFRVASLMRSPSSFALAIVPCHPFCFFRDDSMSRTTSSNILIR